MQHQQRGANAEIYTPDLGVHSCSLPYLLLVARARASCTSFACGVRCRVERQQQGARAPSNLSLRRACDARCAVAADADAAAVARVVETCA